MPEPNREFDWNKNMSDTLMQTSGDAMLLSDWKAAPDGQEIRTVEDKFLYWEAVRSLITTIGDQAAMKGLLSRLNKCTPKP